MATGGGSCPLAMEECGIPPMTGPAVSGPFPSGFEAIIGFLFRFDPVGVPTVWAGGLMYVVELG